MHSINSSLKWQHPSCICLIGTHDVQNVLVSSTHPGNIRVTGDIIDGLTVTGVLVIVYSHSDVRYIASSPAGFQQNIDVTVTGLTDTRYGVSTFTVENGLPFPRVVASPRTVDMDSTSEQGRLFSFDYVYLLILFHFMK